jgi:hypothetical protein
MSTFIAQVNAHSGRAPVIAILVTFIVTAGLLMGAVLPAAYGFDPWGVGKRVGLVKTVAPAGGVDAEIAQVAAAKPNPAPAAPEAPKAAAGPLHRQTDPPKSDSRQFSIGPFGSVEFGYTLPGGAPLVYEWKSSSPLMFDFHTEPEGKPPDSSDSFEMAEGASANGGYIAPYAGIHGWYWENQSDKEVTLTLTAMGFFSKAILYDEDGKSHSVPLKPIVRSRAKS